MFHTWFMTWRTYGTWLPGQDGFVGYYRQPERIIENEYGTPSTPAIPKLEEYSRSRMLGDAIELSLPQGQIILEQIRETMSHKKWILHAVAIVITHVHVVLSVPGDPEPSEILRILKSYTSRRLNDNFSLPHSPRWFAEGGSKRLVAGDHREVVEYVRSQHPHLLVWVESKPPGS